MANMAYCSDGSRVSQATINARYYEARKEKYSGAIAFRCAGCGQACNGSAHIIAQARCKVLHKTELIWNPKNFFPACEQCNRAIENPNGEAWKKLNNIEECLEFISIHDQELYMKFSLNRN